MMKKLFLILALAVMSSTGVVAQGESESEVSGKMVYAELGGPGVGFSFNFDSRFSPKSQLGWGYRVGLGFANYTDYSTLYASEDKTFFSVPLGVNYVFGKKTSPHTFEVGLGTTILSKRLTVGSSFDFDRRNNDGGNFIGHATFMYRRRPIDGGFTWRIGFTPLLGTEGDMLLSAAVGLGYAF